METPLTRDHLRYCKTKRQTEILTAYLENGCATVRTAKAVGINISNVQRCIARIRDRAQQLGYDPEQGFDYIPPPGQELIGVTKRMKDGSYLKYKGDKEVQQQVFLESVESVMSQYDGVAPKLEPPKSVDFTNLLSSFIIPDIHHGMLAHKDEVGADYDCKIATEAVKRSVKSLVASAPSSERALIVQLGDMFHYDGVVAETSYAKNPLDADTRWGKMIESGLASFYDAVMLIAQKYKYLDVVIVNGNHDETNSMTMAIGMKYFFSKTKNINIIYSSNPFQYYEYGENLFGIHHGNKIKPAQYPLIMAEYDNGRPWGRTSHRRFLLGHTHKEVVLEFPGCSVEYFRAVAGPEAYSNAAGYRSKSGMCCLVAHKQNGLVARQMVEPMALVRDWKGN